MSNVYVIDVFSGSGVVDWAGLKRRGVTGAIVKIIRKDLNPDNQFYANIKALNALKMPWGVYNYTYATGTSKARSDMKLVCDMLDKCDKAYFRYGIWLDIEDDVQKKLTKNQNADIINAAMETVEVRGYTFGAYTGMSFYGAYINDQRVNTENWWIARYYADKTPFGICQGPNEKYKPTMPKNIVAWQYTSHCKTAGLMQNEDCDLNLLYRLPTPPVKKQPTSKKTVIIGSARIDENGKVSGGKAGDQTGKEVSTQDWYLHSKGWVVLRPKDPMVAKRLAEAMLKACKNANIGYDQTNRNSLWKNVAAKGFDPSKATACETDCSALVRVCLAYAGIGVKDFTTSNEKSVLMATGAFTELPASQCTSANFLKTGDILITKTKGHTAIVVSGGTPATVTEKVSDTKMPTIKRGSKGKAVKIWQIICGSDPDGSFGPKTEAATKKFQETHKLTKDGVVGPKTWTAGLESV